LLAYKKQADKKRGRPDHIQKKSMEGIPIGWLDWGERLVSAEIRRLEAWERQKYGYIQPWNRAPVWMDYAKERKRSQKNWGILRERIRSLQAQVRKDIMMEVYEEEQMKIGEKARGVRRHRHFKRNIAAGVFFSNWVLILSLLWVNIQ
jgi:hypothetical protein